MTELGIDIETYSGVDLAGCGVYKYAESPDFAVLLFAWCEDGGPVRCADLASGETLPGHVVEALTDAGVVKTAYNAQFERVCLSRWLGLPPGEYLDPRQWRCTMVRAARLGLPLSLGQCAEVLRLPEGKMKEGRALIRYFSVPGRDGSRHLPSDAPDRWELFKLYNIRDVEVEQAILSKVRRHAAPSFDDELYVADQEINDRGVRVDLPFVEAACRFDEEYKAGLLAEARAASGLENPNSPVQLKQWLHDVTGMTVTSLAKSSLDELAEKLEWWPRARKVLELRRELGKTSNKKYRSMLDCVCRDGRIHGLLQFHGAPRTGRWAGRLVQVQNLPQNHLGDLDDARRLVLGGDLEEFSMSYSNVTQTLSELIRTSFVASPGRVLHVCDFSAIEARVIAWLAGERWLLDVFREGGDVYCAAASQMFRVPVEKHGANAGLRQKGKIATLALGYGGGVSALEAMGGGRLGLTPLEMREIVDLWRRSNRNIVKLWSAVERAAAAALSTGSPVPLHRGMEARRHRGMLTITLPSGRVLCYPRARVGVECDDGARGTHDVVEYEGLSQATKKWEVLRTYGGKLVENIVQAIARDILGEVILRARREGMDIVFHVHDEVVVDARPGQTLADVERLFSTPIAWCRDLPLKGAGYTTPYYKKE